MEIEFTRGCVCGSICIDGKEERNLTDKEREKVKKRICEWICREDEPLSTVLMLFAEHFHDEYKCDDEPCECCGDYVETYKWSI